LKILISTVDERREWIMNTLLQASHIGLRGRGYYSWLFKDVNLKIDRGDIIIIYGDCGSGKTLLSDILCGLKEPNLGSVVKNAPLAVATQEFTLYKDLTVSENLDFIFAINDRSPVGNSDIINLTGLTGRETIKAGKLPAGLKKMLQTACAIIQKTPVIIFDEPFSGLDQQLTAKFRHLMWALAKEGRGIVILTNQIFEEDLATQIFKLTANGLIESSPLRMAGKNGFNYESGVMGS
jgi:ABC-type multidrug transport system ATPase subunit